MSFLLFRTYNVNVAESSVLFFFTNTIICMAVWVAPERPSEAKLRVDILK